MEITSVTLVRNQSPRGKKEELMRRQFGGHVCGHLYTSSLIVFDYDNKDGVLTSAGIKGLAECKASASNLIRIQVKDIVKEAEDHLKTYSLAGMDISRVDTMPTNDIPNTTPTTNVNQNVGDEILDFKGGSHVTNVPAFDKEDFTSWKVRTTRIRAFMAIVKDELSVGKADARSCQWVDITMKKTCSKVTLDQRLSDQIPGNIVKALGGRGKRKEKISSKEFIFTKADESSFMSIHEITSDFEFECETQEPLPPFPKLIGAAPACTSDSIISLSGLTLNMADLILNTSVFKKTRPTSVKVSPEYVIKRKTEKQITSCP
nr:hypothetical protein [Tanacetum cinerariifolium]